MKYAPLFLLLVFGTLLSETGYTQDSIWYENGAALYIPKNTRAGSEAKGYIPTIASAKVYVPLSLKEDQKARAWFRYIFNITPDIYLYREFSERTGILLGPDMDSYKIFADHYKRPELKHIPQTFYGHSAGGRKAWIQATKPQNIDKALAVLSHHSSLHSCITDYEISNEVRYNRDSVFSIETNLNDGVIPNDPRGEIPVWNVGADRDKHQFLNYLSFLSAAKASEIGWKWSFALGHGECHQANDVEAVKLQISWMEEVARERIPAEIPENGKVELNNIDHTKGWVGYLELIPPNWNDGGHSWYRARNAAVYPYDKAPGKGMVHVNDTIVGGYVWLPSEKFATEWLKYHQTANLDGDPATRLQSNWWAGLTDTDNKRLGWNLFENDWCFSHLSILNLPDFTGDYKEVKWEAIGSLPEGLIIQPDGRIMTSSIKHGTYKFRLKASYHENSWEKDDAVIDNFVS